MFSVSSVDYYHRILDGIYTETKSLKKILTENALEHLAFGEGFYGGSPYRLDILTIILKIILKESV